MRSIRKEGDASRNGLLLAGLLAGLTLNFREEAYIASATMTLSLLLFRTGFKNVASYCVGGLLTALPLWLYNLNDSASIFGLHAKIYASVNASHTFFERACSSPGNLWFFLFRPHLEFVFASVLTIFVCLLAFYAGFQKSQRVKATALGACICLALMNCIGQATEANMFYGNFLHQSLASTLPLAAIPLVFMRELLSSFGIRHRILAASCLLYILGAGMLLDAKSAGSYWGARHFLLVAPAIVALTISLVIEQFSSGKKMIAWLTALLLLISIPIQFNGLRALWIKRHHSIKVLELATPGAIIASDVFWAPQWFAAAPNSVTVVHIRSKEDLERLVAACAKAKKPFTLLLSPNFRVLPNDAISWLLTKVELRQGKVFDEPHDKLVILQAFHCTPKENAEEKEPATTN